MRVGRLLGLAIVPGDGIGDVVNEGVDNSHVDLKRLGILCMSF